MFSPQGTRNSERNCSRIWQTTPYGMFEGAGEAKKSLDADVYGYANMPSQWQARNIQVVGESINLR